VEQRLVGGLDRQSFETIHPYSRTRSRYCPFKAVGLESQIELWLLIEALFAPSMGQQLVRERRITSLLAWAQIRGPKKHLRPLLLSPCVHETVEVTLGAGCRDLR